jgi:hypothetical protein
VGAELGQPGGVGDVRLAAGQVLDPPGVDEDHVQVLGQDVVEVLPVVRGRLDDHQRHVRGEQVVPQVQDRVRRRSPRRGLIFHAPGAHRRCAGSLTCFFISLGARPVIVALGYDGTELSHMGPHGSPISPGG